MASKKQSAKVAKVMREYKAGTLHSGKNGPRVKNVRQAIAIALSEAGLDEPSLPPKATVGPDTGRTGKHNKPVRKTVHRRPLKGPNRDKVIEVQPHLQTRRPKLKGYL